MYGQLSLHIKFSQQELITHLPSRTLNQLLEWTTLPTENNGFSRRFCFPFLHQLCIH
jgi:hypothetical protein